MAQETYTYNYPRPMVTVDAVVFAEHGGRRWVLLVKRGKPPFAGAWALPGGFVEIDEPLDVAAHRELAEETGVTGVDLRQMYTFGAPDRDPRGRSISVAYTGQAVYDEQSHRGGDDAAEAAWFPVDALPALAFDHAEIIRHALQHEGKE